MNARILIITNGHLCRNPRPLKEAETLGRAGYRVTVLMVRNRASSEMCDAELMRFAPFQREAIDMIGGHAAGFLRLSLRRGAQWAARRLAASSRVQTIYALGPAGALLRRARALPADLTIVHNEVPHWVGLKLAEEGRRVAADFEDWHSEDLLPEDRRHRPLALLRKVEGALLARTVYASTTSHALADALFARYGGSRPQVITNSFPLQPEPRRTEPGNPPAFFWFSQTLGPGRGLELFLAAWARTAQPSRVVFLGEAMAGYQNVLLNLLPPARRASISFLPLVSPAELPAVIARHDIGLALEQNFIVNRNLTITNKILEYLNAGLAVVASDTLGQREVLGHAPEAGVIVQLQETAELAQALDRLSADRGALARRQAAARQLAEQVYCWEKEAPQLLDIVGRALENRI